MTLQKAFDAEPKLVEAYNSDEEVKELIDMGRKLEELPEMPVNTPVAW